MAVGSRGPRGYPDYQRVENWDGPAVFTRQQVNITAGGEGEYETFETSRYAQLGVTMEAIIGKMTINFQFLTAKTGGATLGVKSYCMNPQVGRCNLRVPVLGPYCRITVKATIEVASKLLTTVIPTNRLAPQEAIPRNNLLLNTVLSYEAAQKRSFVIPELASGKATCRFSNSGANGASLLASSEVPENLVVPLAQANFLAGETFQEVELYIPPYPITVEIANGAIAQAIGLQILIET